MGFELHTSGVGSNRSANWATTTAQQFVYSTLVHSLGQNFKCSDDDMRWNILIQIVIHIFKSVKRSLDFLIAETIFTLRQFLMKKVKKVFD